MCHDKKGFCFKNVVMIVMCKEKKLKKNCKIENLERNVRKIIDNSADCR